VAGADSNGVLGWAFAFMDAVIEHIKRYGEQAGFWQAFDAEPDNPEAEADIRHQRLYLEEARTVIGERLSDGFEGIAGSACLRQEEGKWVLRIEAFDTRDHRSVGMIAPMKKSLLGKYALTSTNAVIDDVPSFPGVFTSRADQKPEAGE
jgi:hypothetical protein